MAAQTPILKKVELGTTSYVTESVQLSEALDLIVIRTSTVSETLSFSESVEVQLSEKTPVLKSVTFVPTLLFDNLITLSEQVDLIAIFRRSIDEQISLSEELEVLAKKTPVLLSVDLHGTEESPTETLYLLEEIEIWTNGFLSIAESFTLSEDSSVVIVKEIEEQITTTEEVVIKTWKIAAAEEFYLAESIEISLRKVLQEEVSLSELVEIRPLAIEEVLQLSEAISLKLIRSLVDLLGLTEQIALGVLPPEIAESISFSERIEIFPPGTIPIDETLRFLETVQVYKNLVQREVSEAIGFTELIELEIERRVSEEFSLSEEVGTKFTGALNLFESFELSESIFQSKLDLSESFTISEEIKLRISRTKAESLLLTESVDARTAVLVAISEGFNLSENLDLSFAWQSEIDEEIDLSETLQKEVHIYIPGPTSEVNISESFNLTEEVQPSWILIQVQEQVSLYEDTEVSVEKVPVIPQVTPLCVGYAKPQRFTRCYESWPIDRDQIRISLTEETDSLRITLGNVQWSRSLGVLKRKDCQGKIIRIWRGFLDTRKESVNLDPLFEGEISRVFYDKNKVEIDLKGNAKYFTKNGLRRLFSVRCPFKFKSRKCGYVGPDKTCNKSYEDCVAKGNSKNFGGFQSLLKVQGEREII